MSAVTPAPTVPAPNTSEKKQRKPSTIKPGAVSVSDAGNYLGGITDHAVYDLAARGKITMVRLGQKRTRVLVESMDKYLRELPHLVIRLSSRAQAKLDLERHLARARFDELRVKKAPAPPLADAAEDDAA
jgi:hypothetical protein